MYNFSIKNHHNLNEFEFSSQEDRAFGNSALD